MSCIIAIISKNILNCDERVVVSLDYNNKPL